MLRHGGATNRLLRVSLSTSRRTRFSALSARPQHGWQSSRRGLNTKSSGSDGSAVERTGVLVAVRNYTFGTNADLLVNGPVGYFSTCCGLGLFAFGCSFTVFVGGQCIFGGQFPAKQAAEFVEYCTLGGALLGVAVAAVLPLLNQLFWVGEG